MVSNTFTSFDCASEFLLFGTEADILGARETQEKRPAHRHDQYAVAAFIQKGLRPTELAAILSPFDARDQEYQPTAPADHKDGPQALKDALAKLDQGIAPDTLPVPAPENAPSILTLLHLLTERISGLLTRDLQKHGQSARLSEPISIGNVLPHDMRVRAVEAVSFE